MSKATDPNLSKPSSVGVDHSQCTHCRRRFELRESIATITVGRERLDGPQHVTWIEGVHRLAYCNQCEAKCDLSNASVPGLREDASEWPSCQKCSRKIEVGEEMWSVSLHQEEFTGTDEYEIVFADSLWVVCKQCARDVAFSEIEIPKQ